MIRVIENNGEIVGNQEEILIKKVIEKDTIFNWNNEGRQMKKYVEKD